MGRCLFPSGVRLFSFIFNLSGKKPPGYSGDLDATVAVSADLVFAVAEEIEQEHDDSDEACNSSREYAPA